MRLVSAALVLAFTLGACGPSEAPAAPEPADPATPAAGEPASPAPAPVSSLPADQVTAATDIKPCFLTPEQLNATLGGSFAAGELYAITPETPSCIYNSPAGQFRINVTWIDPAQVEAWKAAITTPMAGEVTAITGDPDTAYYQYQGGDLNTCAVVWVKGNLQYQYRLMTCRDAADGQTKLTALPRP